MTANPGDSARPPVGTPDKPELREPARPGPASPQEPGIPPGGDAGNGRAAGAGPALYAGMPGQGKSSARNIIAAELAARERGPHDRA